MQQVLARGGRRQLCAWGYGVSCGPQGAIGWQQQSRQSAMAPDVTASVGSVAGASSCADHVQVREVSNFSAAEAGVSGKIGHLDGAAALASTLSSIRDGMRHYGRCYWELSKARLSMLVVMTSGAGYILGSGAAVNFPCLGWTCVGTMLAAASANSFNQILEVRNDARMKRTMRRPLPSGRISMEHALAWAVGSGSLGVSLLAYETNPIVAALGAGNILLYTLAYTPLKQVHPVNTWVGAVVGAVPPLMGWAAATGQLDPGAWVLASALYFWQLPHFMALSFMCSKDYLAGGYKMVSGQKAASVALRNCVYLLPIGFVAQYAGITSSFVAAEALLLTAGMGATAALFHQNPTLQRAKHLFRASLLYLPALMIAMLLHRIPNGALQNKEASLEATTAELTLEAADKATVLETEKALETTVREEVEPKAKPRRPKSTDPLPPIAYASAAPFPFLPLPHFR